MSGWLDWLDTKVVAFENMLSDAWDSLVLAERQHPIILALATFIVLSFILSLLCNLCCWCCGLCRPRQKHPGLVFIPANYGTMVYPPPQNGNKQPLPPEPIPSTSKQNPYPPMNV